MGVDAATLRPTTNPWYRVAMIADDLGTQPPGSQATAPGSDVRAGLATNPEQLRWLIVPDLEVVTRHRPCTLCSRSPTLPHLVNRGVVKTAPETARRHAVFDHTQPDASGAHGGGPALRPDSCAMNRRLGQMRSWPPPNEGTRVVSVRA